jgi:hypothetical protein
MRGNQARSVTDRAVDIDDETARTAHQVVMVVPDPPLVPCNRTGRLDAAEEPDLGEGVERIVDGLMRDRRKRPTDRADDGLGVGMRMILHGLEHRSPLLRHTQRSLPQCSILDVSMIRSVHTTRMPRSFERVSGTCRPGRVRAQSRSLPQCRCSILDVSMIRSVHTTRMPRSFERVKERSEHHRRGGRRGQGRAGRVAYARSPERDTAILTRRAGEGYSLKRLIVLSASSSDPAECSVRLGPLVRFRRCRPPRSRVLLLRVYATHPGAGADDSRGYWHREPSFTRCSVGYVPRFTGATAVAAGIGN